MQEQCSLSFAGAPMEESFPQQVDHLEQQHDVAALASAPGTDLAAASGSALALAALSDGTEQFGASEEASSSIVGKASASASLVVALAAAFAVGASAGELAVVEREIIMAFHRRITIEPGAFVASIIDPFAALASTASVAASSGPCCQTQIHSLPSQLTSEWSLPLPRLQPEQHQPKRL
jgi:hypothetical protein